MFAILMAQVGSGPQSSNLNADFWTSVYGALDN